MAVQEASEVDGVTPAPQFLQKNHCFLDVYPDVSAPEKLGHGEKLTELSGLGTSVVWMVLGSLGAFQEQ